MSLSAKNSTPPTTDPSTIGSNTPGSIPSNLAYPPAGSNPAAIAAYHQYYQQYYQYIYSMYNPTQAAAIMQAYAQNPAAAMQGYYNYQSSSQAPKANSQPAPPPPPPQHKPTETNTESKIKINIKFTSESKSDSRKTRFTESIDNVIKEQEKTNKEVKEISHPPAQQEIKDEETKKDQGSDIVFDINKWPNALKNYCAKVYQHYQNIKQVSEDQVTKYLQKRITDAFKIRSDLNIDWEKEALPEIASIRQVAPFSQYQIEQQKRQQQLVAQQIEAKRKQILAQQEQKARTGLMATIKESMKRKKSRSKSRDSGSSTSSKTTSSDSDDDENFIKFKKSKSKNLKRTSDESDDSDESRSIFDQDRLGPTPKKNGKKMSKKERRKFLMEQKRKEQELYIKQATYRPAFGLARKIQSENNLSSLNITRKQMKNIFELEREQDIEHDEALHAKNICIGISQLLEKEYLRLTGPPDPSNVRPLYVLKISLDYVLQKYQKTNDYRYICDQMKAIRQDLTVQQIRNEFTIQVYETHARIAIKNKDRDEFNQCQNQLKSLYNLVSSKNISLESYPDNSAEFIGYRLLYNMLTKSYKDIDQVIKEIKQKHPSDANLKHLLEFKQAWLLNNYVKFFKLYKKSNFMNKCLIEQFIERERKQALKIIIKSYRPTIKLQVVSNLLGYESLELCKKDLVEYKINLIEDNSSSPNSLSNQTDIYIDCKLCNISSF